MEESVLYLQAPVPPEVKGRTMVILRADNPGRHEEAPAAISGDRLDREIEVPARSAVSLRVR